MEYIENFKK